MHVLDIKIRERRVIARFQEEPFALHPRQFCIIETEGDTDLAKVKSEPYLWQEYMPPEEEIFVLREATQDDLDTVRSNRSVEREAYGIALDKIRVRELPMALSAVERSLDGKKMRFFFTAENRIDFRELVKDLAAVYRTRIEMRQIGVRDRSKKIGGFGICGQELCCSRFLQKFDPITIRMAKEQNLALNPTKISGLCGRLMCCLSYEIDSYLAAKRDVPPVGTQVQTANGIGMITEFNYVRNTVNVRHEENKVLECRLDEIKIIGNKN